MEIFDIACFGTSLTAGSASYSGGGWHRALAKALRPGNASRVRAYNLGAGGADSGQSIVRVDDILKFRPRLVTIEFALADCTIARDISLAESESNHVTIIETIQEALPDVLIYLMTMNPAIGDQAALRPVEDYDELYRDMANELPGVDLIDIAPVWGTPTSDQIPDDLHPTWAAQMAITVPTIAAALASVVP